MSDKEGSISEKVLPRLGEALKRMEQMELTRPQTAFLEFCREFGWGKLEVTIVRGEPVASKELERTHRHDT